MSINSAFTGDKHPASDAAYRFDRADTDTAIAKNRLNNGGVVLANKPADKGRDIHGQIVLAAWHDEYVTWYVNLADGAAYHGHYFAYEDLSKALADFDERS